MTTRTSVRQLLQAGVCLLISVAACGTASPSGSSGSPAATPFVEPTVSPSALSAVTETFRLTLYGTYPVPGTIGADQYYVQFNHGSAGLHLCGIAGTPACKGAGATFVVSLSHPSSGTSDTYEFVREGAMGDKHVIAQGAVQYDDPRTYTATYTYVWPTPSS